jgi:hypothetical protein
MIAPEHLPISPLKGKQGSPEQQLQEEIDTPHRREETQ